MKCVDELTREQLIELKERMLCDLANAKGETPSYGDLSNADKLVSDDNVMEAYRHTSFTDDDFDCTAGKGEEVAA